MRFVLLGIFLIFSQTLFSQNLIGIWRGYYSYDRPNSDIAIALHIEMNPDSTLNIHSYTLFKNLDGADTTIKTKAKVLRVKKNILDIEEVDSTLLFQNVLQRMYLKYEQRGEFEYLEGIWKSGTPSFESKGSVIFVKLKEQ